MLRRWSFGLALSLLAHASVVALGLAIGARGTGGAVDVELADFRLQEVKDFPLGAPESGAHPKPRPRARARARSQAPAVADEAGTLATRESAEKPQAGSSPAEDDAGPAPTSDLGAYGPQGSRVTVLMRLDRLRGTDYQAGVDELLMHLPDRRDLLTGTGLDLFADFDAVLVATPNPLDPSVTFLAARHHVEPSALRAALARGAHATDRTLVWRKDGDRLIGERRLRRDSPPPPGHAWDQRDDRIVVLASPKLAILTPPAYRKLLLGPQAADHDPPDGGAGTARPAAASWSSLLSRIDAEEGLVPSNGVVMLKIAGGLRARGAAPGEAPSLFGMEVPPGASAVIGIDDGPFLDVVAEFPTEAPALHWEAEWPALQSRLRINPYAILTGFSSLISRASLTRAGNTVSLHVPVTHDETLRLLALAQQLLVGRGL